VNARPRPAMKNALIFNITPLHRHSFSHHDPHYFE
jgi:hypothetical protein